MASSLTWRVLASAFSAAACSASPGEIIVSAPGPTCLTTPVERVCYDGNGEMVFETDVGGDLSSSYTTWVSPGMTYTRSLLIHAVEPGDIFGLGGATDAAPADCRCIPVEPVVTAEGNTEWAPPAITGHIAARGFVQFGTGNSSRYEFDGS